MAEQKEVSSGKVVFALAASALTLLGAYRSFYIVPPKSYAVHIRMGQLIGDHEAPGPRLKYPLFDSFYPFNNNTIIFEKTAGGTGDDPRNTSDQNVFKADLRIHYVVDPSVGSMVLKVDEMEGDNGQSALETYVGQSVDAVVGSRSSIDTLADPNGFLKALLENLKWRLAQNNMPVKLDSIELLSMCVGGCSKNDGTDGLRKPFQLRILSNGQVVQMAGPAAIAVTHGSSNDQPALVDKSMVVPMATPSGPTVSTAPRPSNPVVQP